MHLKYIMTAQLIYKFAIRIINTKYAVYFHANKKINFRIFIEYKDKKNKNISYVVYRENLIEN